MKNRLFTTLSILLFSCFLSAQGPQNWSPNKSYTHPALVINGSTTYLSLRDVPSSTSITDTVYWSTLDSMVPTDTPTGSDSLKTPDASDVQTLEVPNEAENLSFRHSVKHLNQEDANDYLIEKTNIKKYSEWQTPPLTYFGPSNNNKEGKLTYKYSVDGSITSAKLKIKLDTWNFNAGGAFGSGSGEASAWVSNDGIEWINIIDIKTPKKLSESKTFHDQLPQVLLGQKDIFLQIRMTVHGAPNSSYTVAQFGRSNANSQSEIFYIELEYSEGLEDDNPPSPPSTEPGTPPADDYLETIAALQKQIEQLTAELNDAKEEISKKDETIAELQSTNLELSYENDELRGELAEEVEKNDVLTAQVANLTQDNNNLKYELGVATKQAEEAVKMAQVPFINGWVYDNDRGWIFTDADHYPMVYTHKTNTWHYYELGSNPRFFFNFTSQQWEAWDDLSEENDSNLADSNNF